MTSDVLALFGYGHADQRRLYPVGNKGKGAVFGAFTGAELLRNPPNRVFNVRASYFDETGPSSVR